MNKKIIIDIGFKSALFFITCFVLYKCMPSLPYCLYYDTKQDVFLSIYKALKDHFNYSAHDEFTSAEFLYNVLRPSYIYIAITISIIENILLHFAKARTLYVILSLIVCFISVSMLLVIVHNIEIASWVYSY